MIDLDAETISWLGRPLEPLSSYPIDANDIRRWAQTAYYPERPPRGLTEVDDAKAGPWRELVALRDFNPFAWVETYHPEAYPWMRGMGTEPGYRGLNGGQKNLSFAPIRPGDVIVGDRDGVAVVAREEIETVIASAEAREAKEAGFRAASVSARTDNRSRSWSLRPNPWRREACRRLPT